MSRKVTINQGRVVPAHFRFIITVMVFIGMGLSLENLQEIAAISVCIGISFLIPLVWSSFYLFQIIPEEKIVKEGYLILGLKKMEVQKYTALEKIFINSNLSSQTMHGRGGQSSTFTNREFQSFVKTTDGKKFELISSKSEEDLIKRLKPIAKKLALEIEKNY